MLSTVLHPSKMAFLLNKQPVLDRHCLNIQTKCISVCFSHIVELQQPMLLVQGSRRCALPVNYTKMHLLLDMFWISKGSLMKVGINQKSSCVHDQNNAVSTRPFDFEVLKILDFSQTNLKLCSKGVS